MCGIIGYIGKEQPATQVIIEGLKRLEYRGYDSAGIAVLNGKGVVIKRAEGKLSQLEKILHEHPIHGTMGIGHTRWATHGRPNEMNAHPHRFGPIVVVHNGIIENHNELKQQLASQGHVFESETDSEVVCHLVDAEIKQGKNTLDAFQSALKLIRGSYSLVVMNELEKGKLYVARYRSPLVIGFQGEETFVASDVPAILPYTRDMLFLEDGDRGVLSPGHLDLYDRAGMKVERTIQHIPWNPLMAERGGYKHFMLKEIFEQPASFEHALLGRVLVEKNRVFLSELIPLCGETGFPFEQITIVACGTSWHAGLVGKYVIESLTRIPVSVELASEFRYRQPLINESTLVVSITQSGETADTLAAVALAKKHGGKVLAICNAVGSTITRQAESTIYTHAGPEIGVASTKAFVTQLAVLILLALDIAQRKHIFVNPDEEASCLQALMAIPRQMREILDHAEDIQNIAEVYSTALHALFVGRGLQYPVSLEGALKLKEISYLHAEGFAAGELKHGPIALIDHGVPVIAIALKDRVYEKMLSNIEEVQARGASVIAIINEGDTLLPQKVQHTVSIPETHPYLAPILTVLPLQLFAYYVADHKGTDVDQPRNLAKSVTVE